MLGLIEGIKTLMTGIFAYKRFIPIMFVEITLFIKLFASLLASMSAGDWSIFINDLSNLIFATDYSIYNNINNILVNNSNIFTYLDVLSSILLLYYIVKWTHMFVSGFQQSSQGIWSFFISVVFIGIIETMSVRFVNGVWFFPYTGMFLLIVNLPQVVNNFTFFNQNPITEKINDTITQVTLNTTNTTIENVTKLKIIDYKI